QNDNWMMLPKESDKPVDVFYLYLTAWGMEDEEDNPICTIDYEPMRKRAQAIAAGQATAFETVGNIYAPYYRQIDAAYLLSKPIREQPQYTDGVPGTDALAAFDYYMKRCFETVISRSCICQHLQVCNRIILYSCSIELGIEFF
ncbi:DUF3089 domain-containing protein, partial [Eubacteriales bacterium DFI.9.88]|nr:DUF3089 domain-containing protein [Eubacteriales bacterium DFI.9.88]